MIGSGQASVIYTASPLNNCSFTSSSDVTGVSSTRTISFIPSVQLKQDSVLVITLPAWFGSMANEATGSLTCTGIAVYNIVYRIVTQPIQHVLL